MRVLLPLARFGDGAHQDGVGGGGKLGVRDPGGEHVSGAPREHPRAHHRRGRQRKRPRRRRRRIQKAVDDRHQRIKPVGGRFNGVAHQRRRLWRRSHLESVDKPAHKRFRHGCDGQPGVTD
jgi:hypothetical protein